MKYAPRTYNYSTSVYHVSGPASMSETEELIEATHASFSQGTSRYRNATFDDLLKFAAKDILGDNIELRPYSKTEDDMACFKNSMSIRIVNREEKPTAVGRTVVDMYTKEYKNYGVPDAKNPGQGDITKTLVHKTSPSAAGRKYQFISNQGIAWNIHENLALQILAMGMSGGTMGLYGDYCSNMTSLGEVASALGASLGFTYNQEETITLHAGQKMLLAFTTYITEYHLRYKLEFRLPKMSTISVKYRKPCCGCFCRGLKRYASIYYRELVHNLPEYQEDDHYAYFTQEGVLSWLGESCEVTKNEAMLD